jgi:hypothetical protein
MTVALLAALWVNGVVLALPLAGGSNAELRLYISRLFNPVDMRPGIVLNRRPVIEFRLIGKQDDSNERKQQGQVVHRPILLMTRDTHRTLCRKCDGHRCQSRTTFV